MRRDRSKDSAEGLQQLLKQEGWKDVVLRRIGPLLRALAEVKDVSFALVQ